MSITQKHEKTDDIVVLALRKILQWGETNHGHRYIFSTSLKLNESKECVTYWDVVKGLTLLHPTLSFTLGKNTVSARVVTEMKLVCVAWKPWRKLTQWFYVCFQRFTLCYCNNGIDIYLFPQTTTTIYNS